MKIKMMREDRIWICVYRDTIEERDENENENLTELLVIKNFARQYYDECVKQSNDAYGNADEFFENYTADDTEDFYKYAKEHNAIIDRCNWDEALSEEIKNLIRREASLLKDVDDSVGINISEDKGLFIQVVDYGEGKEYLIELNDIEDNGAYEPCADYNASSEYGDIDRLIACIEAYLKDTKKQSSVSSIFSLKLEPFDLNSVPDVGKMGAEGRHLTIEEISDIFKECKKPFDLNSVPDVGKMGAEGRLLTKEEISDIFKECKI